MSKYLLVDANNVLVRAVHAADRLPLSADGVPTGALLVFINLLARHIKEEQPTHVAVCWDGGKSAYRTALDPAYKANREQRVGHDEPDRPFAQAKEFLSLAGVHHVERAGWEADDLIACYWRTIRPLASEITILSADKDLLQLLGPGVRQIRPGNGGKSEVWTAERLEADWGVRPDRLARVMALTGDAGDNVPGVRGYGLKTAVKHLAAANWDLDRLAADRNFSEEVRQRLTLSHRLVDLREVPFSYHGLILEQPPEFRFTAQVSLLYPELVNYLLKYKLESVRQRLLSDSLWI